MPCSHPVEGVCRKPDRPDDKLEFLRAPESYGPSVRRVECIETHMSWVFLTEDLAFKLKKAVCFPFLDFTTLKAREFYCREEVRLNKRMAPGVYLGVAALRWDGAYTLVPHDRLPAPGQTVDWLVMMRRLPLHRMLHQLIPTPMLVPADIDALVDVLGAFFRSAAAVPLAAEDYLTRFEHERATNRELLLQPCFQLRDAAIAFERLDLATAQGADLLRERARGHRVLDGHGDLRPEHICLLQPPLVIDCLEFNPRLRQLDPFDELAYLGLECAMQGAPWIGRQVVAGVAKALDDYPHPALLHLYTAHRALLRARLAVAHLLDPQPRSPAKWIPLGERYVASALAASEAFISAMRHGSS